MRTILTIALAALVAPCLAWGAKEAEKGSPQDITVVREGEATGSLEDAAVVYFREVAFFDSEAGKANAQWPIKDLLRERDGLTDAEADEVIAVARTLNTGQAQEAFSTNQRDMQRSTCEDLKLAATTEEAITVLSAKVAREAAEKRVEGVRLLAQLKPATRSKVYKVLVEYRKGIKSGTRDWSKANADHITRYKTKYCSR